MWTLDYPADVGLTLFDMSITTKLDCTVPVVSRLLIPFKPIASIIYHQIEIGIGMRPVYRLNGRLRTDKREQVGMCCIISNRKVRQRSNAFHTPRHGHDREQLFIHLQSDRPLLANVPGSGGRVPLPHAKVLLAWSISPSFDVVRYLI